MLSLSLSLNKSHTNTYTLNFILEKWGFLLYILPISRDKKLGRSKSTEYGFPINENPY